MLTPKSKDKKIISDEAAEQMLKVGKSETSGEVLKQVCLKMDEKLLKRCDAVAKAKFMTRTALITSAVLKVIEQYEAGTRE